MTREPEFDGFLRSIVETLEGLGLPYMIGGSVASSVYGEARSTRDVDISVVLPWEQVGALVQAFQALNYYVFAPAIMDAILAHQPFSIIDAQSGYKADMFVIDPENPTPQEQQVMQRCRRIVYDESRNAQAVIYAPEDVIVYKLKYYLEGQRC
jgi:hypothetical protein